MDHKPVYDHVYYLSNAIRTNRLRERVKEVAAKLSEYQFDAIAFRGMSGTLFAGPLALLMPH